jgi:branched-chain amino acid transport system permease protein
MPTMLKFGLPALGVPIGGATAEHVNLLATSAALTSSLPDR